MEQEASRHRWGVSLRGLSEPPVVAEDQEGEERDKSWQLMSIDCLCWVSHMVLGSHW